MKHTPVKNRQQKQGLDADAYLETISELQDEKRMQYLFSNFPQKESNPKKWEELRSFWTKVVYDVCRHKNVFAVTLNDLKEWLHLRGMIPFGLENLLCILETDKKIQHIADFTAGSPSFSGWVLKALASSLYWGYGKLVTSGTPKAREGKYVVIDIIKDYAEELMSHMQDTDRSATSERIMLLSHIAPLVPAEWKLSNEDLKLVLVYLEKIKQLAIIQLDNGTMGIKLNSQVSEVTESDRGVLQMHATLEQLEDQVSKLNSDISSCVQQAAELLKSKNRSRALFQLKRKKLLQDVLDKRMENIHKIQQILLSIDSATTNNQVMEALSVGVDSLKQVNQKFTVEKIDHIVDELRDALADQAEIDQAMSANVADSTFNFDESELTRELDALVAEDTAEKEEKQRREQAEKEEKRKREEEVRRKAEEEARDRQREEQKRREKTKQALDFDEAQLEADLEQFEREEQEKRGEQGKGGEQEKGDEGVDALADLVGGVSLNNKAKDKEKPKPMLA